MALSVIETILYEAGDAGASDVHITAGLPPRMRVNGELITMKCSKMMPADTMDILLGILPEAQRGRLEERGEYDFSFSMPDMRCRVHAYKQRGCVALVFRLMGAEAPSLKELGLEAGETMPSGDNEFPVLTAIMELCGLHSGLVLAAGSSGCGKSTTLASMIDEINVSRDVHILTLENPIEYLHQHKRCMVNQREIGVDSQSYANGLYAALHEDADVILVGELTDMATVNAAVTAAQTGHLVFSAVLAADVEDAVSHLIEMFPTDRQAQARIRLANVLEAVIFQRLVPAEGGMQAEIKVLRVDQTVRRLIAEGRPFQD